MTGTVEIIQVVVTIAELSAALREGDHLTFLGRTEAVGAAIDYCE